jgi:NADH dehydrogenase
MKIVIIGGGFAGLKLANRLSNKEGIELLLIDKVNYHQFQPLFYQVATAGLDASNISFPLRKALQKSKNVQFRIAELLEVDKANKAVITSAGTYNYDVLVLATGADTNFFGNANLEQHAFPMKSTVEALELRNQLIDNLEQALATENKEELQQLMTIVVVGGGPTGVEVSGALAEMRNNVLPKDYPELDFSQMCIYLLEGTDRTLAAMSSKSSLKSKQYLETLGVKVRTNTIVKDYDGKTVVLQDGTSILSSTVIWAAGIKGNAPTGINPELISKGNRLKTNRFNQLINEENIYALGDLAYMETPLYPNGHPQVANVAINQAVLLADNLLKLQQGKQNLNQFEYKDQGSMATVGRHLAVVDIPKLKLHIGGFLAWLIWMGLHLVLILGVKNRIQVFVNWVYKYFTYDQSLRLFFKAFNRQKNP